jgi:hypothetical protein
MNDFDHEKLSPEDARYQAGRVLLRVVAMLVQMVKRLGGSGSGSGSGSGTKASWRFD